MPDQPYYAVARGRNGKAIYRTWSECCSQVRFFKGSRFKKFNSEEEAQKFIDAGGPYKPGERLPRSYKLPPVRPWGVTSGDGTEAGPSSQKKPEDSNKRQQAGGSNDGVKAGPSSQKKPKTAEERGWDYATRNSVVPKGAVVVYTDGACVKAKAGIGVYWGDRHPDNVSERLQGRQTNNCAEIQAAVRAVQQAKKRGVKTLVIRTDSKFMFQSITEWVPRWQRNGWKTVVGKDVINKTDFTQLLAAMEGITVKWEKVKAHAGIKGNEMANKFASEGVRK